MSVDATDPARCPHRPDFDPLVAPYLDDPFAVLDTLTPGERPIFYSPVLDYYVVTGFAEIDAVFTDPDTFSAANAQAPLVPVIPEAGKILLDGGHRPRPSMVSLDPPEHTRLRRPSTRAFSAKRVNGMADLVRATAGELLDAMAEVSPFDLVATLAFPLPANIIFALMGVPPGDYPQLREWCGHRAALSWGRPRPDEQVDIATNMVAYRRYLLGLVESKVDDRTDDFTSDLLAIYDEDPDQLRLEEIASILFSLSFAGHETTNYLIGNTVRRLLEDPARWERVVADPQLAAAAVEETLRYDPSVPVWRRVTTRPTVLGGVELPEGAKLFLWLAAAGRNPAVFADPAEFQLNRVDARRHLAFGRGVHHCLGANLGRLEAMIAVQELAARFPRLELAEQELRFHPNISFRGPQQLWLLTG